MLAGAAEPVRNGFGRAETGATAIEYALVAALVSVFIVSAVSLTGNSVTALYALLNNAMIEVVGN
jgi:Flp pilus assembly pilin Flp